jgi:hypothetical protein
VRLKLSYRKGVMQGSMHVKTILLSKGFALI